MTAMSSFEIHKQNEIRKLDIEVKALIALAAHGIDRAQKYRACRKLEDFAYPEKLANKINQEIVQKQLKLE